MAGGRVVNFSPLAAPRELLYPLGNDDGEAFAGLPARGASMLGRLAVGELSTPEYLCRKPRPLHKAFQLRPDDFRFNFRWPIGC
jgi:hypothetical protein